MPTVTALRAERRDRVVVDLDGAPWRSCPAEAVLRAGLVVGCELDRPRARLLRRELRRAEALGRALGALRVRDLSSGELGDRLGRAGFVGGERSQAIGTLGRAGLVDNRRLAHRRAAALAERDYGNDWIRFDLERRRVPPELAAEAVAALEPEAERAARVVREHGGGMRTARRLARRGFGDDAVEAAAEAPVADDR